LYLLIYKSAAVYGQSYTLILNSNPLNFKFKENSDSIFQIRQIKKISNYYIVNGYATFNIDSISVNNKKKKLSMLFYLLGKNIKLETLLFPMIQAYQRLYKILLKNILIPY